MANTEQGGPINIHSWLEASKGSFQPPVCNKIMYDDYLKIMFVGGPNVRKDYHIEAGEEFFYMFKGDMCLKVMEKGKPKDVHIKEGEIFILPSKVPHSPQRNKDTIGLVIERERLDGEIDGLRYYCEDQQTILYESWFHCVNLVKDLPPVIHKFFASEQHQTGKPIPGTIPENPPLNINCHSEVMKPINLKTWIEDHRASFTPKGRTVFHDRDEFKVTVCGGGVYNYSWEKETWLWQLEGDAEVDVGGATHTLASGQCWIVPPKTCFSLKMPDNSVGIVLRMEPSK